MSGYTKIVQSGDLIEVYQYQKKLNVDRSKRSYNKGKRKAKKPANFRTVAVYRSNRSISRARQSFFRLVSANLEKNNFPSLCTFTFIEKLDIVFAYKALAVFFRSIKKEFPSLRYIAVPEWQKRGFIHFHAIVWGIDSKAIFDEVPWHYRVRSNAKKRERFLKFCSLYGYEPSSARGTRNLQRRWARGYFDILGATDNNKALAGYLAKYLVKGLADPRLSNNRAFSSSHNVNRPRSYSSNSLFEDLPDLIPSDVVLSKQKEYATVWLGTCTYKNIIINKFDK